MKLKILKLIAILLLLFFTAVSAFTQIDSKKIDTTATLDWISMMQDPNANFYETQNAFHKYWAQRDSTQKGTGFKVFKRWEYINQSRVLSNGKLPAPDYVLNEYSSYFKKAGNSKSAGGNWTDIGPSAYPTNATSQPTGMGRINAIGFHPTNANIFYIGAPAGGLWKTTDGGATWSNLSSNLPSLGVSSILIHPTNTNIIYIGTGDRDASDAPGIGVYKSVDGGVSWSLINNSMGNVTVGSMVMHPSDPNIIIAATSNGIYKTINGGTTWSKNFANSNHFKDIKFKPGDPTVVYATQGGKFFRSADTGNSWTEITSGIIAGNRIVIGVSPANANIVYLSQAKLSDNTFGGIMKSTDAGLNFSTMATTPNIYGYECSGSGINTQATYDLCIAVDPSNANVLYIGSINIWKSTDGGANLSICTHWSGSCSGTVSSVHADQHALEFSPVNNYLFAGNDGGLYKTSNNGTSWTELSSGLPISQIYRIGVSQTTSDLIINGYQDNGVAVWNGSNFTTVNGGDGTDCAIDYNNSNYRFNSYVYGIIRRNATGGNSYSTIGSNGTNGINEAGPWVTPFSLHKTDYNTMFAGYKNVWRTTNVRTVLSTDVLWTAISSGETSNCSVIEQSLADVNILYAVRSGSIKRSDNANAAAASVVWNNCNLPGGVTPNDIKTHPANANIVYAVAGYKIYKSIDKGLTWTDISINLPSVNNICLVYDKNSTEGIYIGNELGVWYKDATMPAWVPFTNGLPPVSVRELEIYYDAGNPANNKIYAATYGRGLWRSDLIQVHVIDPSNFTAVVNSSSQINLNWTKNAANDDVIIATSPTILFGYPNDGNAYTTGNTLPNGGGTVIYNGSLSGFNHTTLNPATTYYYKIWSVNGSNLYSAGLPIITETTDCAVITSLPYNENFDIPSCWRTKDNTGQGNWKFGTISNVNYTPALSGDFAYFSSQYGVAHNYNADLISPPFDLSAYPNVLLQFNHLFDASNIYASTGTVYYSIDNGSSWISLASYSSDSPNPQAVSLNVNGAANQSQVKFKWTYNCSPTGAYMWNIDDIQISDNSNYWTGNVDNDWFNTGNWSKGAIPTATTPAVIPSAPVNQPQINAAGAVCLNLNIQTGASLTMNAATAYTLSVSGDWTNNGTFNRGIGIIDFNGSNNLQLINGNSTTNFYILSVSKGLQTRILEAISLITLNAPINPLVINSGTFKLSSASTITPFTSNTTINSSAGLWNNGGTINPGSFNLILDGGLLRVSAGSVSVGLSISNYIVYMNNGKLTMEGGILNIAGRFSPNSGTSIGTFNQSGGFITVNTIGSTSTIRAPFEINSGVSFTMTGGTIIIQRASSNTNADYINLSTTNTVTGGSLQIGNASTLAGQTIRINSTAPIYNLIINATNTPVGQLVSNTLTVKNDVTISGGTLNTNNLALNFGGNWTNNGTLNQSSSIITLNGSSTQIIGGSTAPVFSNLTIDGADVTLGTTATSKLTTISNALVINSGKKLTIPAMQKMTVNGTLTNNAGVTGLILKSDASGTASLIHNSTNTDATVERYIPLPNEYHMLASPHTSMPIYSIISSSDSLITWNEPSASWFSYTDAGFSTLNGGLNLIAGKGYAASFPITTTKTFTGSLNNSIINIPLTFSTGTYQGWNFIANPYPSSINWNAASGWNRSMLEDAGSGERAFWIWNPEVGNYGTYISNTGSGTNNVSNNIAIGQGFWVKAGTSGTLSMDNNVRVHSTQAYLKSAASDMIRLSVNSAANNYSDEIIVKFGYSGNSGGAEKMHGMNESAPNLYSTKLNKNWSINFLPSISQNTIVAVGFKPGMNGNYSLKATELNSFTNITYIYLKDLVNNTLTDLNQHTIYPFNATSSDNTNRFQLIFSLSPLSDNDQLINKSLIYAFDKNIYINYSERIIQIKVYTALGLLLKTINNVSGNQKINMSGYSSGYYMIKVVTDCNVFSEKLILK